MLHNKNCFNEKIKIFFEGGSSVLIFVGGHGQLHHLPHGKDGYIV